ncbi:CTP synthase [Candidatus Uabimicrobium sp. HlEnr_7]|uniref:CTP synthase n=1 Tax=Candidatus Uabimicrobium helgolandensis TaxID=3095367 RepID=UPI003555EF33
MTNLRTFPKYIFVTGGVCSSLGKGIASASIGALLKASGYKIFVQKLDPYLNIDPGTMSPSQHGEVYVTDDGAETDLDIGHYERFIDVSLSKDSTVTTGKIYTEVLTKERRGDFLGGTIQIIPHITDAIKERIQQAAKKSKCDIMIIEIGGTIGDIEGEPFIEAMRQFRNELGSKNVLSMHMTLLPYLKAAKELKTKPTQLSVRELKRQGIQPDFILARADYKIPQALLDKISLFCGVEKRFVIPVTTSNSIYEVPVKFYEHRITELIAEKMQLQNLQTNIEEWEKLLQKINASDQELSIGLVGKYMRLEDSYISIIEALKSACYACGCKLNIVWINAERLESQTSNEWEKIKKIKAIIVPGGFGNRGIEGKVLAAKYARIHNIPYLGICLGAQILAIEYARYILNNPQLTSEEFDEYSDSENHVIHFLPGQSNKKSKGGTLRVGSYPCNILRKSIAYESYNQDIVHERHRHRYEFNNYFRNQLSGLIFSGIYERQDLVEIMEIKNHPFMVGCQFHPEFKSRPHKPHPLFFQFIKIACMDKNKNATTF